MFNYTLRYVHSTYSSFSYKLSYESRAYSKEAQSEDTRLSDQRLLHPSYGSQIVAKFNIKNLYQNQQLDT